MVWLRRLRLRRIRDKEDLMSSSISPTLLSRATSALPVLCASAVGIWSINTWSAQHTSVPSRQNMMTTSGKPLRSFFEGLPISPAVRKYAEINFSRLHRTGRPSFAVQVGQFFGIGAVVHAQTCGGCNEMQAPPVDCGCGAWDHTT